MPYDGRVYRILIASPSDVEDEREIAVRVIQEWNDLHSHGRKIVILPLRWETHTAPEFNMRPQEVINRAIVDECDLLVGIFWTRIGSPTGAADSGTLEEIERAGKAGKPIMLYFSKVAIDPDNIDTGQIERLKQFKAKTYPEGLVEHYKSHIEFRDKFSKQIEMRVRELQRKDTSRIVPFSLQFYSLDDEQLVGSEIYESTTFTKITNSEIVPAKKRKQILRLANNKAKLDRYVPVILGIKNTSSSGINSLYAELMFFIDTLDAELTQNPVSSGRSVWAYTTNQLLSLSWPEAEVSEVASSVERKLPRYNPEQLQRNESGWTLFFDWSALQPQRTRLIKPIYLFAPDTSMLTIQVKIFAESLPEPLSLSAIMHIDVQEVSVDLAEILPNWKEIAESKETHSD